MIETFQGSPVRPFSRAVCSAAETVCTGLFLVLVSSPLTMAAQGDAHAPDAGLAVEQIAAPNVPPAVAGKVNEWVVVPIPTLNPSQGFGLQLVGQYIFKSEAQAAGTPSSILGVGGFYNERESWGVFGGYMGHWKDDLWRPTVGGGYADLHYDFYGIGNGPANYDKSVEIDQQATLALGQLMRRIIPGLYGGLRLAVSQTDALSPGLNEPPVVLPPFTLDLAIFTAGLVFQWDTRDNQFYPTTGQYANLGANFHEGDDSFQTYELEWNCYHALGDRAVVAGRVYLRATGGDAPFFALSSFGMHNDLRGFKGGKYRDKTMFATQVEYRRQLSSRWGCVVFAGVGEVAPSFGDMSGDDLLVSGGAGLRFRVAKSHPVNLRLDWAYGDESSFYLGVSEAF